MIERLIEMEDKRVISYFQEKIKTTNL